MGNLFDVSYKDNRRTQSRRSGVFIDNFQQISHTVLFLCFQCWFDKQKVGGKLCKGFEALKHPFAGIADYGPR